MVHSTSLSTYDLTMDTADEYLIVEARVDALRLLPPDGVTVVVKKREPIKRRLVVEMTQVSDTAV